MTDNTENLDALLTLLELSQGEIAEALGNGDADGAARLRETCSSQLENILWACEQASVGDLYLAADALHTHLASDSTEIDSGLAACLLDWFGDARVYVEQPTMDLARALLAPLPAEMGEALLPLMSVEDAAEAADATTESGETWMPVMGVEDATEAANPSAETGEAPMPVTGVEHAGEATDFPAETGRFLMPSMSSEDEAEAEEPAVEAGESPMPSMSFEGTTEATKPSTETGRALMSWMGVEDADETAGPSPEKDEAPMSSMSVEDEAQTADLPREPVQQDPVVTPFPGASETDPFAEATPELADDDLLGMLAHELREVMPELEDLTLELAQAFPGEASRLPVEAYLEILGRVDTIAAELDLEGLTFVCAFLRRNLELIASLYGDARAQALEMLRAWPDVVIDHLLNPEDDSRCLAVVDFLELESWPEPVPYRDLRSLIEGLAKTVEVSAEFVVEAREIEATAEDVSLDIADDTSQELINAFFAESPGHAENLSALMASITQGVDVQDNVEAAQRLAHTLKGSGNLIGARGLANLSHHLEDIFEYIARHHIQPPPGLSHTMQEASDLIEAMIEALQGLVPPPPESQRVLQDVLDWANRIDSGQMREGDYSEPPPKPDIAPPQPEVDSQSDRRAPEEEVAAPAAEEFVRVPLKLLDSIFRLVSETAITGAQIQERLNRLEDSEKLIRGNDGHMQQQRYELENLVSIRSMAARHRGQAPGTEGDFDALEMDEYDEFYSATHAYIETVADSREILRGFTGEVYELDSLFLEQQRINKELQQMVMTTRLVPVSTIASRLQRAVRQVCRSTGKEAELSLYGQDLLLDGDVLNKLADPLMHMLRNAVDHGIEDAGTRAAAGKPRVGMITLEFVQEGNNIVINCSDDGRGLDYERIRATAIERGLIAADDDRSNEELAPLILHTGFSTRDAVTQVSGRGVGMDVVHNTVQSLNGTMKVADGEDRGTRISLRMPITLLTSHCLLTGIGKDNLYAIPTLSLTQILSPGIGFIENLGDALSYRLEDETYPACTLNSLIGSPDRHMLDSLDQHSVLLVRTAGGITAVVVERVVTSYDLVVKNMGAYVKSISGIAGVSMLGNGEVVPVLDLAAMLVARDNGDLDVGRLEAEFDSGEEVGLTKVMIVDDSLSVRNSLGQLMRDSGYEVLLARDGLEAINIMNAENPDIVLTDLEMPRMNGLELVSYIRNTSERPDLPVVMITSRNMAKHRQQADHAGINRFIAKPFVDDDILECIETELSLTA